MAKHYSEKNADLKFLKGKKIALVMGEEVKGLPQSILKISDTVVEIPMYGKKESLNVSVAAGVALFQIIGNKI